MAVALKAIRHSTVSRGKPARFVLYDLKPEEQKKRENHPLEKPKTNQQRKPGEIPMSAKAEGGESGLDAEAARATLEERQAAFLRHIAEGGTWRSARAAMNIGNSTISDWLKDDRFAEHYARACDVRADALFEEMIEIADTPVEGVKIKESATGIEKTTGDMIEHRRLQIETRKWLLGKMRPKKYGDKIAIGGADDLPPIQSEDVTDPKTAARRIAFALAQGAKKE